MPAAALAACDAAQNIGEQHAYKNRPLIRSEVSAEGVVCDDPTLLEKY